MCKLTKNRLCVTNLQQRLIMKEWNEFIQNPKKTIIAKNILDQLLRTGYTWSGFQKAPDLNYSILGLYCQDGHLTSKELYNWLRSWACEKCTELERARKNFLELNQEYEKRGYKLASKLIYNSAAPVLSECPQNHWHMSYPNNFLKGQNCSVCAHNQKKHFEDVRNAIEIEDYKIYSTNYVGNKESLMVSCHLGHQQYSTTWDKWYNGHRCPHCKYTKGENDIGEFLKSLGVEYLYNDMKILGGKQLDFYLEKHKVAIEYNGLYFHSEDALAKRLVSLTVDKKMARAQATLYHKFKRDSCSKLGIRLFTIFENDWLERKEQVQAFILGTLGINQTQVYARNGVVAEVDHYTARCFIDKYHWQGSPSSITHAFGFFQNDVLLQVITFGHHHRQNAKKDNLLLNRFCNKAGTKVVGGASRIFQYALEKLPKDDIITYADLRYASGEVYLKMGFKLDRELMPDYHYFKGQKLFSKQSLKKNPGESDLSEKELRASQNYRVIWDCGKHVYKYKRT